MRRRPQSAHSTDCLGYICMPYLAEAIRSSHTWLFLHRSTAQLTCCKNVVSLWCSSLSMSLGHRVHIAILSHRSNTICAVDMTEGQALRLCCCKADLKVQAPYLPALCSVLAGFTSTWDGSAQHGCARKCRQHNLSSMSSMLTFSVLFLEARPVCRDKNKTIASL